MESFERLEVEFGAWAGLQNVVATSSGTASLHLALEVFRLPQGSEVLIPDFTMVACARAVTLAGLTPVFVDCGNNLLMRKELCREAVTQKTRAVMLVHVYGRQCDTRGIINVVACRMMDIHGVNGPCLYVVEDLAEAHGVAPNPRTDASCYSFYRNKIICGEEGGAVAFRHQDHATLARQLRTLGFTDRHDFMHVPRGHNYRLANSLATLVLKSLAIADVNILLRRQIEALYDAACPDEWRMPPREACWVFDVRVPGLTWDVQARVVQALNREGIAARMGFRPMTAQEEYRNCRVVGNDNAVRLSNECFYLPVAPGVTTEASIRRSFEVIRSVLGERAAAC